MSLQSHKAIWSRKDIVKAIHVLSFLRWLNCAPVAAPVDTSARVRSNNDCIKLKHFNGTFNWFLLCPNLVCSNAEPSLVWRQRKPVLAKCLAASRAIGGVATWSGYPVEPWSRSQLEGESASEHFKMNQTNVFRALDSDQPNVNRMTKALKSDQLNVP